MRHDRAGGSRLRDRQLLFRIAVTVEVVLAFVQPVLAGSLLSGNYDMLALHRDSAFVTIAVAVVMTVLAFLMRRVGGPPWLVMLCAAAVLIEGGQISWGYQRALYIHIPLGVMLAAGLLLLLIWAWSPVWPAGRLRQSADQADTIAARATDQAWGRP